MSWTSQQRCAALAAWTTAALRGRVPIDDLVDAVKGTDETVSVRGLDDAETPLPLASAVGQLRALAVTGLLFVPAEPGNAAGLPGPPAFNAAAIAVGGAVLAVDGSPLALLPLVTHHGSDDDFITAVEWQTHQTARFGTPPADSVTEAEQLLLAELNRSLDDLARLDVAQWRDAANDLAIAWRQEAPRVFPPGLTDRAQRLIQRSDRIREALDLAQRDDGGAVSGSEVRERQHSLTALRRACLVAGFTAWNSGLAPMAPVP